METEEFRPVVGFEGLYEVSNLGRVRSVSRMVRMSNGRNRFRVGKALKPSSGQNISKGYPCVGLYKDKKMHWIHAHRIVVSAFISSSIPDGFYTDHINRNKEDNRVCNLRLVSSTANALNRNEPKNNTSGRIGVYFVPQWRRWSSRIYIKGKQIHLGYFETFQEAVKARESAESKFWSETKQISVLPSGQGDAHGTGAIQEALLAHQAGNGALQIEPQDKQGAGMKKPASKTEPGTIKIPVESGSLVAATHWRSTTCSPSPSRVGELTKNWTGQPDLRKEIHDITFDPQQSDPGRARSCPETCQAPKLGPCTIPDTQRY
jgi:hypothetical protein